MFRNYVSPILCLIGVASPGVWGYQQIISENPSWEKEPLGVLAIQALSRRCGIEDFEIKPSPFGGLDFLSKPVGFACTMKEIFVKGDDGIGGILKKPQMNLKLLKGYDETSDFSFVELKELDLYMKNYRSEDTVQWSPELSSYTNSLFGTKGLNRFNLVNKMRQSRLTSGYSTSTEDFLRQTLLGLEFTPNSKNLNLAPHGIPVTVTPIVLNGYNFYQRPNLDALLKTFQEWSNLQPNNGKVFALSARPGDLNWRIQEISANLQQSIPTDQGLNQTQYPKRPLLRIKDDDIIRSAISKPVILTPMYLPQSTLRYRNLAPAKERLHNLPENFTGLNIAQKSLDGEIKQIQKFSYKREPFIFPDMM